MELDKFIKMIPGGESKRINVDLHSLTFTYQEDYNTAKSLESSKKGGSKSFEKGPTGATMGTDSRRGSSGGEGDPGGGGGGV